MARKRRHRRFLGRLLGSMEKRDLINAHGVDAEVLRAYGELYLEAGRFSDALDFFLRAEDREGLEKMKARAIDAADNFLLHRIEGSGLLAVTRDDWQALADSADRLGKSIVAEIARSRSKDTETGPLTDEPSASLS